MAPLPERCLQLVFLVRLDHKYPDPLVVELSIGSRWAPESSDELNLTHEREDQASSWDQRDHDTAEVG